MAFATKFDLDTAALIPGSAGAIELSGTTSADVLLAVTTNGPLPDRPIELLSIGLNVSGAHDLAFHGGQGTVKVGGSATADLQLGVFDKGADVLARLALQDADEIGLTLQDDEASRYMVFRAGYTVLGSVSGAHPIGVLGAATFGVEGQRARRLAAVHRFDRAQGAHTVFRDTLSSIKLPRHVVDASALSPSTHLITEVDGSLAVKVGARLGYDFTFIREARLAGLQGDVGLKLDAGIKAAMGLEVAGRYLLALERPGDDPVIRLRLFSLKKKGLSFGFNLSAKVQGVADLLPEQVDDLVTAVFGVHGQQVIKDLKLLETWTDPKKDLSDTVAGLVNKTGLELLEEVTGLSPKTKFNQARGIVLAAIDRWEKLPSTVSTLLWSRLASGLSAQARKTFVSALQALASNDPGKRRELIASLLARPGIDNELIGEFLTAAAERGLLALLDQSEALRAIAATTLEVLDGGVIERLQTFVADRLNLDAVLDAVKKTDFDALDQWLVQRLSIFFDRRLRFEDLDTIKDAIHVVIRKRQEVYVKVRQALTRRYDFDLAASYQATTGRTALVDASFDTSKPAARRLLGQVVRDAALDELFTTTTAGVTLGEAVLSHAITRQSTIEVHFPSYDAKTTSLTKSLASVRAQEDGGRVLFYELTADDRLTKNRLKSQLSIAAALPVRPGAGVRVHGAASASWSYQFLQAAPDLRRSELEQRLEPLVHEYFREGFPGESASLSGFLTDFDRAVEDVVHNGSDEFGDLLLSLEVTVPGTVMGAWFQSRSKDEARVAARRATQRVQACLQRLIPFYYFRDLDRLHQNAATAPLLVFAALPPLNQFRLDGGHIVEESGPIWDVFDPAKRAAAVSHPKTVPRLAKLLAIEHARLVAAGRKGQAAFFELQEARDFLDGVSNQTNFIGLLRLLSVIADGIANALDDLRAFESNAETRPSLAIERLADFGAEVARTFNKNLSSTYGGEILRPLGSLVFLEAACALDSTMSEVRPNALLSLTVLKEERTYTLEDFLANTMPPADQVAVQQRLVSV
jgi:hypothetical protein